VHQRNGSLGHSWFVHTEGEAVDVAPRQIDAAASFDAFFVEEHERLFRALYFITGDRRDAEDLMQDAFAKLWERWDRIGSMEDPTGYLFRVALNGFRMRRRHAAVAAAKVIPGVEPRDAFGDAEMRADLQTMLARLTPRQRAALLLVDLLGYGSVDAARIMQVRPSTVRALASHARGTLRLTGGVDD
jgi:RNA polymerase sigma-70 factor (ECF subfamily)